MSNKRLIDGEKLLEDFETEKEVYSDNNDFSKGVRYMAEKYRSVILLHTYDIPSNQGEAARELFALSLDRRQLSKMVARHGGNPTLKEMLCAEADGITIPGVTDGGEQS